MVHNSGYTQIMKAVSATYRDFMGRETEPLADPGLARLTQEDH